jgi:hypothetical protein
MYYGPERGAALYSVVDQLVGGHVRIAQPPLARKPAEGLRDYLWMTPMSVIPNPANNEATLVLTEALDEPGTFVVFDALGAEVLRYQVPIETLRYTMNTEALAPAMYHYRVLGPTGLVGAGKLTIVR